jgi:hypothetical protein
MFPFRYSAIFRSRWMALLWAGGILWTAYDFAGSHTKSDGNASIDASGEAASPAELKQAQDIMNRMSG